MEKLERGEQILVVQKNLLPVKEEDLNERSDYDLDLENLVFDRLHFVWLTDDDRPLRRKITFTYRQIDHGEDQENLLEPTSPKDDRIPVIV